MGLFDRIFGKTESKKQLAAATYFKTLTAYQPVFYAWNGELYESERVRAAIDARARHIAKLEVKTYGAAKPRLQTALKKRPNPYQSWSQFLYRTSTILDMQNNCFIVPILDIENEITGYWACLPSSCAVLEDKNGTEWLRYKFSNGEIGAVEYRRCGIMTKFQYKDDFFGESNRAMSSTMELINLQQQGIREAIKNGASFRFMARLTNFQDPDDLAAEQKAFSEKNLSADASGFLLFPNTYDGIQQIKSDPYTVNADQMKLINENVNDYFAVNDDILQSKAVGDQLDGFFDSVIEPFAIMLSEILTLMSFSDNEIGHGSRIMATANRLQYMKTSDKIQFVSQLGDRGLITVNEARELLNYPPVEGGDIRPARGEYFFLDDAGQVISKENNDGDQN